MEIVEVVFESDELRRDPNRVVDGGNNSPSLFFGRESLDQEIHSAGDEQLLCPLITHNGVRLARIRLWPLHEAAAKVARIDQGRCIGAGIASKKRPRSKVHNSAC